MKKMFILVLSCMLLFGITGCGNEEQPNNQNNNGNKQEEQKQEEPEITNPLEKLGFPKEVIQPTSHPLLISETATKYIFNDDFTLVTYAGMKNEEDPEMLWDTNTFQEGTYKIIESTDEQVSLELVVLRYKEYNKNTDKWEWIESTNPITEQTKLRKVDGTWKLEKNS